MANVEPIAPYLAPLRKSVVVRRSVPDAFALFTTGVNTWWPLRQHSINGARAVRCGMDAHAGGEVYEIAEDGTRCPWGHIAIWDPPTRLVLTWHPGRAADTAQEVEVRFFPAGDETLVELEHRGWQRLGVRAAEIRESYGRGWDRVLGQCFVEAAATS
jgi:uncharacterized protein YndB with AHSA1/START domain